MLKRWIEQYIVKWAVEQFTIENLKLILARCVEFLKVKSYETENYVDDWAVEILEGLVNDENKMKILYDWLYSYIAPGVCKAAPALEDEKTLINDLIAAGEADGKECKAIPVSTWEAVLNLVIPFLIEFWRQYNK